MEVPPEERARAATPGPLTGKTYVLTGTLASMTREEADRGASSGWARKVAGSVSKKTAGVIVGADAGQQGRQGRGARRADAGRGGVSASLHRQAPSRLL